MTKCSFGDFAGAQERKKLLLHVEVVLLFFEMMVFARLQRSVRPTVERPERPS